MSNPFYHFDIITESGALIGILLYWQCSGYAYVEHFAIQPSMRNKSAGTAVSKMFFEKHPVVILEIDPVIDDVSARRERFYQRLGFKANGYGHKHPAYQRQFPPHELIVMSYPEQLTEKEYLLFRRELENVVMKDVFAEQ